ncbi:MAG: adenylyltransferase/cytidyltransferase family protein [Patescibacteria group bacterium]
MNTDQRIIFANGVFDLLHPGHIKLLQFAKAQGEYLIVGLNSDRSVRELKGPTRPIHSEQDRKIVLESLRFVDEVIIFDEVRPTRLVAELRPHVIVKGDEYSAEEIRRVDEVPEEIEIVLYPVVTDEKNIKISTTTTIRRMQS